MAEALELNKVVTDCERYWRATDVPGHNIADMKLELSQHLAEATSNGRQIGSVIGGDLAEFAETWAAEYRAGVPHLGLGRRGVGSRWATQVGSA